MWMVFTLFNLEGTRPWRWSGDIAQLGERLPCKQEVSGSIPLISTNWKWIEVFEGSSISIWFQNQKTSPSSPHQKSDRFLMKKEEQQSGASFRQKPEASEAEFATTLCTLKTEQYNTKWSKATERFCVWKDTEAYFNCGTSYRWVTITISLKNCLHNSQREQAKSFVFDWSS